MKGVDEKEGAIWVLCRMRNQIVLWCVQRKDTSLRGCKRKLHTYLSYPKREKNRKVRVKYYTKTVSGEKYPLKPHVLLIALLLATCLPYMFPFTVPAMTRTKTPTRIEATCPSG